MTIRATSLRTVLCTLFLAAAAHGAPPTDEQVDAFIARVKAVPPLTVRTQAAIAAANKARAEAITAGLKDLSLAQASVAQLERLALSSVAVGSAEVSAIVTPRLTELAKDPGVSGACAAELRLVYFTPYVPAPAGAPAAARTKAVNDWYEAARPVLKEAFTHPAALELVKAGKGSALFARLGASPAHAIREDDLLRDAERLLVPEMSIDAAAALGSVITKLADRDLRLDKPRRNHLLDRIAAAVEGPLARPIPAGKERTAEFARNTALRARSAFARGELIGSPAPAVPFSWSSDPKLTSLADVTGAGGSIVIVEFWAARFDSCAVAIPYMRRLADHYAQADSPVRIISITSPQGIHITRSLDASVKPTRIDCRADPAKEYALMPQFMTDMGITWPVAFTPDGCFNPNFGVQGIPHIAVIDAAGKVRYNELRPFTAADYKAFAGQIDALLREAGLPVPTKPLPEPPPPPAPPTAPPAAPASGTQAPAPPTK
ncbi:MAG TPA: TlpA disulfide reductase family protein [Phycisphaerales bacterium]|nr:TlpA disulfide reductase family protein [Phycisphaerales bacterium]